MEKQKNSPVFEKTGQGADVWVCFPIALDAIRELFKQCWVHAHKCNVRGH